MNSEFPAIILLLPVGFAAGALTTVINPDKLFGAAFPPLVSLAVPSLFGARRSRSLGRGDDVDLRLGGPLAGCSPTMTPHCSGTPYSVKPAPARRVAISSPTRSNALKMKTAATPRRRLEHRSGPPRSIAKPWH